MYVSALTFESVSIAEAEELYYNVVGFCFQTIPRSFLEVIPEAGHWAMLETPSHLSHMILCFIDWWAPPNRAQ